MTRVYADALREGREPTAQELSQLEQAFSRQGFTDGYYMGESSSSTRRRRSLRADRGRDRPSSTLAGAFSHYYMGEKGPDMFGTRQEEKEPRELYAQARSTYENGAENRKEPVRMYALIQPGQPASPKRRYTPAAPWGSHSALRAERAPAAAQAVSAKPCHTAPSSIHMDVGNQ